MNASHVRKVLLPVLAGGMALCLALPDVGRAAAVYPIDRASMLAPCSTSRSSLTPACLNPTFR